MCIQKKRGGNEGHFLRFYNQLTSMLAANKLTTALCGSNVVALEPADLQKTNRRKGTRSEGRSAQVKSSLYPAKYKEHNMPINCARAPMALIGMCSSSLQTEVQLGRGAHNVRFSLLLFVHEHSSVLPSSGASALSTTESQHSGATGHKPGRGKFTLLWSHFSYLGKC